MQTENRRTRSLPAGSGIWFLVLPLAAVLVMGARRDATAQSTRPTKVQTVSIVKATNAFLNSPEAAQCEKRQFTFSAQRTATAQCDAATHMLQVVLSAKGYQDVLEIIGADQALSPHRHGFATGVDIHEVGISGGPSTATSRSGSVKYTRKIRPARLGW